MAYSENDTIRGIVLSALDSSALSGATVVAKNLNIGVRTDQQGRFVIKTPSVNQLQLIISSIGYAKDTIDIPPQSNDLIRILLMPDARTKTVIVEETGLQSITKAEIKTEKISLRQLRESACCSLAESFERSPSVEVS